jgi:hypothetical protein
MFFYRIVVLQPHGENRRKMNFVQNHLVQQLAYSCQGKSLWGTCVCAFVPKSFVTVSIDVWKRSLTSWWDAVCTPNEQGHHLAFASLYLYPSVSFSLFRGTRRSCLKQLANSFKRPFLMSYSCANTLFCDVAIAFEMLIDVWHGKLHNRFFDQISNRVGILINNKHEYIL